ncbi:solute:sodium symporter family transporter [Thermoactinomyces intermedius]|uniref:Solute:sodium symporter family transporter n=1 Tax=Thermoactinomyces intermedius TaxID=2024 RepID=A0A8I1ABH1_THEIN|nr:solute:sodium symporter family transporter [Thermoactinomyces intermedius]MBA4548909.1 solute:sodium symporter family transporter [Thermoactinomyces intermedius]MBA4836838.1 solute:sodium symporter family transporter [Thermoactinomyces intermedius]MBH8594787.1 solute:sodium symporter family transporter [Thermoactinomyces intermedius]
MFYFSILSFILVIAAIWIFAYKRSRIVDNTSSEGYFLGGRSLTGITIAGSILMTNLSTEQIVGQNGQSYMAGMEVMAWEVTAAVAIVLLALVFLPKYLKYGVDTVSDFIEKRYDTTTKRIVSILFIFTYMISFLPVVLYSGSLVFNKIFRVNQSLGIDALASVALVSAMIGMIGLAYLLMGGLSLGAFSDSLYGVGLLIGGLSIPVLGLIVLGNGSFTDGFHVVRTNTPEMLNAIGAVDSKIVPWPTLFFGMFFNNLFYWCTNQMIVQKAFAGRNLKEGQKGVLYVGFFKIIGALFLVFPGIIAFNLFGNSLSTPDDAYPSLVAAVLPGWAYGIFGAVIFGAILSSFVGALNATATLFTLDFYKPVFNPNATDRQVARAGKAVTVIVGLVAIVIAPLISFAPTGLYNVVQQFNGLYSMPLLAVIVLGFYSKNVTAFGAKVTFAFHVVTYALASLFLSHIHYLYVLSVLFLADVLILWWIGKIKPADKHFVLQEGKHKVDLTPWKHAGWVGALAVVAVLMTYLVFSPLGLAR